ncbi:MULTISPECIES: hypothetical protein [Paraburkholderia]|uniref:hypothetical protein n=1 Tax=Paraburkholderia TaxID=1822464 RepID=UPI0038B8BDE0
MQDIVRRSLYLRVIYALCLAGATWTHLQAVLTHGLSWDYGNVALFTRIYWTSLLFIDLVTALLPLVSPAIGLILCIAVIVTDVAHNSWFAPHHPIRMDLYLSQIVFLLFVAFTVRTAWRGAASRCAAPHVIG